jgi:hypothetical protein
MSRGMSVPVPSKLLARYSPLVIAAAVQLVVVLVAPSTPVSLAGLGDQPGTGSGVAGGSGATGGATGTLGSSGTGSGTGGGTGTGGSGSTGSGGTGSGTGGSTVGGSSGATGQVGSCPGLQPAPWAYMPPCRTFTGANAGASMPGVTAKEIRYVWYEGVTPAALAAIGSQAGLAFTEKQLCEGLTAYTKVVNKRWQLYGRHLVPLDGPGSHSGMANGDNSCRYPYYQGDNCDSTDAACWRAQADVIASMKPKPAFVVGGVQVQVPFLDELAKKHILVLGQGQVAAFAQPRAPYVWDWQMSGENVANFGAEYFCQKLAGKPVTYAGPEVLRSGSNPTVPPVRKIAIIHDVPVPDTFTASAKRFMSTVKGCGGGTVDEFPFAANVSTLPQDMQTIAAKIKLGGYTTVYLYMDLIAAIPLSNDLDAENWHPEMVIAGNGAIDDDKLGQLMNQNVWRYAFGPSLTKFSYALQQFDFYKAYKDSGATDDPAALMGNAWPYFWLAGDMFQTAGPAPTIGSIQAGMFSLPLMGGQPAHPAMQFGVPGDGYLGQRDIREVWWCPTRNAPNGRAGVYVGVDSDRRWQHGQIDKRMRVYPQGVCGA